VEFKEFGNQSAPEFGNQSAPLVLLLQPQGKSAKAGGLQLPLLSKTFCCIVPRPSNNNHFREEPEALNFREFVAEIMDLLDFLEICQIDVAGRSARTAIAAELALALSGRLSSLSLYSAWLKTDSKLQATCQTLIDIANFSPDTTTAETAMAILQLSRTEINAIEDLHSFVSKVIKEPNYPTVQDFIAYLKGCIQHDITGRIGQITAPTLVISGTSDQLIDFSDSQEVVNSIPGATIST